MTDPAEQLEFVRQVLALGDMFNETGELWDSIHWRTDREYAPFTFFVNCNDLFYWACADLETLTPENLPMLLEAITDVRQALGVHEPTKEGMEDQEAWNKNFMAWESSGSLGAALFCARVRKMRPQRPCYKGFPESTHKLFDACGPVRDPKSEG